MRNSIVAFICRILVLIFAYVSRVVFIRVLDVECTGAYGLFDNILIICKDPEMLESLTPCSPEIRKKFKN